MRRKIYNLALVSSADTIDIVVQYFRSRLLKDVDHVPLIDVVFELRKDLKLEIEDDLTGLDLAATDKLLTQNYLLRSKYIAVRPVVEQLNDKIMGILSPQNVPEGTVSPFMYTPVTGNYNGVRFDVQYRGGIFFPVTVEYPSSEEGFEELVVLLNINVEDATSGAARALQLARETGFDFDEESEDEPQNAYLPTKDYTLRCRWVNNHSDLTLTSASVAKSIARDILAITSKM